MNKMLPMLNWDLDGVYADFHGVVQKLCGKHYHENPSEIWPVLEKIPHFFDTLPMLDGSKAMYEAFMHLPHQFLTALPKRTGLLVTAPADKPKWVARNLNPEPPVICVSHWTHKKHFCVRPGDILVDDMARNIEDWEKAGGVGVLHVSPESTIKQLQDHYSKLLM